MRIDVDRTRREGHGRCADIAANNLIRRFGHLPLRLVPTAAGA